MLAATSPIIWYSTRATGTVALVLLTGSVLLGILTTTRVGGRNVPRFALTDLHRRVSLIAVAVLALHILTAVIDTYVPIGWTSVIVPFTSKYQPLWIGLGTIAFDLLLAVVVTSVLRSHISARAFRGVHWLAYASWPVAVAHGIGTGTDLRFGWMQIVVALCIASVLVALGWRILANPHQAGLRTAPRSPARTRSQAAGLILGSELPETSVPADARLVARAGSGRAGTRGTGAER